MGTRTNSATGMSNKDLQLCKHHGLIQFPVCKLLVRLM